MYKAFKYPSVVNENAYHVSYGFDELYSQITKYSGIIIIVFV